jgi:predicted  nucleic acid-binding Zn-ribbon protein
MAGVPVMLILGGALATYLGIEEIKDKKASETFETDKDDLKREVNTLKKEISELKDKQDEPTSE